MTYTPDRHHRRSIRMPDHDYGGGGAYFLTLCVNGGSLLFGEIADSTMRASEAGSMVERTWYEAADVCDATSSVAFQLMPNHIHGLLVIASGGSMRSTSLPEFIRRFKTITARRYADGVESHSWARFDGRLWQRGYYEHLIRDDRARNRVVRYIEANPARWIYDRENPSAVRAIDA